MNPLALADRDDAPSTLGWLAFVWGGVAFSALLANALYRLVPFAWGAVSGDRMGWWHWLLLAVWVAIMAYFEGYRGFQLRFSPRFAARAKRLAEDPSLGKVLLAPFFCMGLFHATKRALIVSWSVLVGVVLLILAIRHLDQPWRGIIDAGVVIGLGWGWLATLGYMVQVGLRRPLPCGPDLPERQS